MMVQNLAACGGDIFLQSTSANTPVAFMVLPATCTGAVYYVY